MTSFEVVKYLTAKIELVEEISCDTKKELLARERHYIENNTCVNKVIPGRTYKEWRKDNREEINRKNNIYMKDYMKKNKYLEFLLLQKILLGMKQKEHD